MRRRITHFIKEAQRRKVYTAAAAYLGISLILHEVAEAVFQALRYPPVALSILTIILLLFFPIVLVLAWIFDIGPQGMQRTDARPLSGTSAVTRDWQTLPAARGRTAAPVAPLPEIVAEAPAPERMQRASIALVRHELRTPINAIIGYSEMLLEDVQEQNETALVADLESTLAGGRELNELVNRILGAEQVAGELRDLDSYGAQIRADLRVPLDAVIAHTESLIAHCGAGPLPHLLPDLQRILGAARRLLDLSSDIAAIATEPQDVKPAHLPHAAGITEGVLSKIRSVATDTATANRSASLLIVDDSPINRDLLARQLAHRGYLITTAEHGLAALERINEQSFDLILLDVLMPELDGIETLRRIKSDAASRDIPVIMISALDEMDSVIRCLEIGAADFLSKPFHPTLLDARINATLNAHHAPAGAAERELVVEVVSAGFPRHLARRVQEGERRILESTRDAVAAVFDVEHAVAKLPAPADRAAAIDALSTAAQNVAAQLGIDTVIVRGGHVVMIAGFPLPDDDAAEISARAAQAFAAECDQLGYACRAALHRGMVCGAVIGSAAPSYWLWGEAYDVARKLVAAAERGRTLVSPAIYTVLHERYPFSNAGIIELPGHGQVRCHVLEAGARPAPV